jgi:hypothetical protein
MTTYTFKVVIEPDEHGEPIAESAPSGSVEVSSEPLVAG